MTKLKIPFLIIVIVGLTLVAGGRLYARQNAKQFGVRLAGAFSTVGPKGFADTATMRDFFAEPEMAGYATHARQVSFLGGGYAGRIEELEAGVIYLSQQMSQPPAQRFASSPALKHFAIETSDHSDAGVAGAAGKLIESYLKGL